MRKNRHSFLFSLILTTFLSFEPFSSDNSDFFSSKLKCSFSHLISDQYSCECFSRTKLNNDLANFTLTPKNYLTTFSFDQKLKKSFSFFSWPAIFFHTISNKFFPSKKFWAKQLLFFIRTEQSFFLKLAFLKFLNRRLIFELIKSSLLCSDWLAPRMGGRTGTVFLHCAPPKMAPTWRANGRVGGDTVRVIPPNLTVDFWILSDLYFCNSKFFLFAQLFLVAHAAFFDKFVRKNQNKIAGSMLRAPQTTPSNKNQAIFFSVRVVFEPPPKRGFSLSSRIFPPPHFFFYDKLKQLFAAEILKFIHHIKFLFHSFSFFHSNDGG